MLLLHSSRSDFQSADVQRSGSGARGFMRVACNRGLGLAAKARIKEDLGCSAIPPT